MHRFFVSPQVLHSTPIRITGEQAHQIRRVIRMRPGDPLVLLDNAGWSYQCTLLGYEDDAVNLQEIRHAVAAGEPRVHVTLFQAVLKGDHFAWALQKCTEVGIGTFVPVVCRRSVVGDLEGIEGKRERWERIIQEAAEQSGRGRVPILERAEPFGKAIARSSAGGGSSPAALRLIPWEGERRVGLREALEKCNPDTNSRIQLFVGPEGGFADDEIGLAREYGLQPVSLGPRILRAETAAVAAAAAIFYQAGEMVPPEE